LEKLQGLSRKFVAPSAGRRQIYDLRDHQCGGLIGLRGETKLRANGLEGLGMSSMRPLRLALERARKCEEIAASVTDQHFRAQWLDLARQWRKIAEWARHFGDDDSRVT
jgi:hypothetical protein